MALVALAKGSSPSLQSQLGVGLDAADGMRAVSGWISFAFGLAVAIMVLCGGAYIATGPWPIPVLALLTLPIAFGVAADAWRNRPRR